LPFAGERLGMMLTGLRTTLQVGQRVLVKESAQRNMNSRLDPRLCTAQAAEVATPTPTHSRTRMATPKALIQRWSTTGGQVCGDTDSRTRQKRVGWERKPRPASKASESGRPQAS
jgi:hypothetical protein